MADTVTILIQSIQSVAVILIIVGMLIAFLWKAAFYINLGLGLIITILVTYLVNAVGGDAGLTLGIFVAGLIGSIIAALIGGFLCLLEGFILSTLGFWALWVSGSPTSILSAGTLVGSAIAGAFSTGIAAFLGDRAVSLGIFKGILPKGRKDTRGEGKPLELEILPEDTVDDTMKKRIYGYVLAHRKFKLTEIAEHFGLDKKQAEDILLEFIADGKIIASIDSKTGMFTLESKNKKSS